MKLDEPKDGKELRRKTRFAVSDDCVLSANLTLWNAADGSGGARKSWPATLVDASSNGAHVHLSLAAVATPGDSCILKVGYGRNKIEVRGTLAHYVCAARYSMCGLSFDFSYGGSERAYQRIYEVIVASASLAPSSAGGGSGGQVKEEYRGEKSALLQVWRNRAGGPVSSFDYAMCRFEAFLPDADGDAKRLKEMVRFRSIGSGGSADAPTMLSGSDEAEARWEFAVAASNLPESVPVDVRKFFRALV